MGTGFFEAVYLDFLGFWMAATNPFSLEIRS